MRTQRVLAALTAVVVSAIVPGSYMSRHPSGVAIKKANGVYLEIPLTAPKASSGSYERDVLTVPGAPGAVAPTLAAAPHAAGAESPDVASGPGIRTVASDAFGDPFNGIVPASAATGPCAKATTCKDYQLRPPRWPHDKNGTSVISWKFNDAGRRAVRAPAGLLESAVNASMAEWSRWDSNIAFRYGGTTSAMFGATGKDGSCADGTNVITWDKFDPSIIAMAGVCMDNSGKVVRDADLAMNVSFRWENINGKPQTRHSMDIRSIVTHELGHWLGLVDLYGSNEIHQTMSGYSEYGETNKRTPALGDVIGIQKAFPCGAGDSCPRSGIVDD